MIFTIHFQTLGGHVHCRISVAKARNMTSATCGDFVVSRGEEFVALERAFSGAEFVPYESHSVLEARKP